MEAPMIVSGTEYQLEWMADEFVPRILTGVYTTHEVPEMGYTKHLINGICVDPATIVLKADDD
jgi:hypothetical protein